LAVPVKAELEASVASAGARLQAGVSRTLERHRSDLRAASRGLATPDMLLSLPRRALDEATGRLGRGLELSARKKRNDFQEIVGRGIASPEQLLRMPRKNLEGISARLSRGLGGAVLVYRRNYDLISRRLSPARLTNTISRSSERLSIVVQRQQIAYRTKLERINARLGQAGRLIETLSHKRVLERGYAVVFDNNEKPVLTASAISSGDTFSVQMSDGRIQGLAQNANAGTKAPKPKSRKKTSSRNDQGDLF